MATQDALRVTKDTSARKNTRVGSIESAVQAAAMEESHDCHVQRLIEGFKQQLETMEQGYEEQIRELKSQHATDVERTRADATEDADAKAGNRIQSMQQTIESRDTKLKEMETECDNLKRRAKQIEKNEIKLNREHRAELAAQRKWYEARLDQAQLENQLGPYQWIEVKLVRKFKSTMGAPKPVVKRGSTKFIDLVKEATTSLPDTHYLKHPGHMISDTEKKLTQLGLKEGDTVVCSVRPFPERVFHE